MRQFLTTLRQIANAESVGTFAGVCRHAKWQMRRLLHGFPCELEICRSKLVVDEPGGVGALVNAMGEYDYNNMEFIRECMRNWAGTFVDVGANVGAYTLIAAEVRGVQVLALEAHPRTFCRLQENVNRNGCSHVSCVNVAISDREGHLRISEGLESSLNFVVEDAAPIYSLPVASQRLDILFRAFKLQPTLIKIDVEGHELPVLQGLGEFSNVPKAILVEGGDRSEIRAWMREAGFAGPWFVHFRKRILNDAQQKRREDPVYINQNCLAGPLSERIPFGQFLDSVKVLDAKAGLCR